VYCAPWRGGADPENPLVLAVLLSLVALGPLELTGIDLAAIDRPSTGDLTYGGSIARCFFGCGGHAV
jgi:hypothetical protein